MIENSKHIESAKPDFSRYLVDLVMNQDHVAQNWIKFFITIEAGLAAAFSFAFGQAIPAGFQKLAIFLIPIIAIALAISLTLIIVREHQWQNFYIQKFNQLSKHHSDRVFPKEGDKWGSGVAKPPYGLIAWAVICLAVVIVLAWFSALVMVVVHPVR